MKRGLALTQFLALLAFSVAAQAPADRHATLTQARQAYYSLHNEGLASFTCSITPDWNMVLADARKQNPSGADAAIKILNQLHFTVTMGTDGTASVTHNELSGMTDEMNAALKQIYGGMEQMTTGFYDTWKLFVMDPPFPAVDSDYQIDPSGSGYRLSYTENQATKVVTSMDADFSISSMKVTNSAFDSTIQPRFIATPHGLLMTAYDASYNSQKPEEATILKVFIDYQDVQGVKLVKNLNLTGSYGGTPFAVNLALSDCQATRK